ncbi:hypothetical protein [Candidatus Magnetomonas plexicatena]|uniref:hypothetical protein n=1 Tax=Candidatus Magnetomonas plexicatena TaxID=2552947 RepID=UPI001C773EFA|nr:hypothetical protein E2O03_013490 [Nitrospirales bacterium LBB_01]
MTQFAEHSLVLWLQVKNYYATALVYLSAPLAAVTKGASFESITPQGDAVKVESFLMGFVLYFKFVRKTAAV